MTSIVLKVTLTEEARRTLGSVTVLTHFLVTSVWQHFLSHVNLSQNPWEQLKCSAPDVIQKDRPCRYGPAVDMWAFGVCLYAMFTGAMPFPDPDESPQDFYSAVIETGMRN